MTDDTDLTPEYIDSVCRAAPFADNDAGIPQMVALIRALSARLAEVEADRDVWMADSAAAWDKCEERRLLQEAAEVQLAQAVGTIKACREVFRRLGFEDASIAIESIDATIAKIGEGHE
jgi:hypothetical protein